MDTVVGQIVHYRISQNDVQTILNQRRTFEAHELEPLTGGNDVRSGEIFPAIVIKTFSPEQVSLKVLLDGPDDLWMTSKSYGNSEGQWQYAEIPQTTGSSKQKAGAV